MRTMAVKRLKKFYSSPSEEMHKVSYTTEGGVEQTSTLLTIKTPSDNDKEGIRAYSEACETPALRHLLPHLLSIESRQSDLLVYFEPIQSTMRTAILGMSRDSQWYHEEGLPTFAFLVLSLQLLHANHFIHGNICLDTVFYTQENLFKLGHFRQAKKVMIEGQTDLRYYKDVKDLGNTLICYATLCEMQDQVAAMNDKTREKFISERFTQFPELAEVLIAMTKDNKLDRVSAEMAFSMLNRLLPPELEEQVDPPQSFQQELEERTEVEMSEVLKEIQEMVNSRNVASDDLIKITLANFNTLHETLGGTVEGKIEIQSVKCSICGLLRREKCTIKLSCLHRICLPCFFSNTLRCQEPSLNIKCRECLSILYIGDLDLSELSTFPRQLVDSVLTQLKARCPTCGKSTTHTNSPLNSLCSKKHSVCLFCKKDGHPDICQPYAKAIGIS